MTDIFSKEKRSAVMRAITGKDTKPEIRVRKHLFSKGYRYRKNVKKLTGTPDIVMRKRMTVVFVHGCFWHGHDCSLYKRPQSNTSFWDEKIRKNKERDKLNIKALKAKGWHVITVWECQLKNKKLFEQTMKRLVKRIDANG